MTLFSNQVPLVIFKILQPPTRQVLEDQGYDGAMADLWSCGVILFVLLAGYLPFEDSNLMALYKKVSIVLLLVYCYGLASFMLI